MISALILTVFVIYFVTLFLISKFTSKGANNQTFYTGNRKVPWHVVAFGMIGASLSGVTFMSVPGYVQSTQFTYFGVVLGYLLGYAVIAFVLLPLYYRLNLTSIYMYLGERFGAFSHKTGSFFFIVSRLLGSSLRMYLVVFVLYEFVFKIWGIPFWVPAVLLISMILFYTLKGGIKTVVWTDSLQTIFMLAATIITVIYILNKLDISFLNLFEQASKQGMTKMFETDWRADNFFLKQILSGAFITIAMTGLDQDMMQRNLTCKTLKDSQKNIITFSFSLLFVNFLFLALGVALLFYLIATGTPISEKADNIFPSVAFNISPFTAVVFVLGLIAAGYSSADGTLTSLTTSFCYDFLGFKEIKKTEEQKTKTRKTVHIAFALLFLFCMLIFKPFHNDSLIKIIFDIASYTYGPLLGLFAFGLFTKRKIRDKWAPVLAILSPIICFILNKYSIIWFNGYKFGFELLIINGLITFIGLFILSVKRGKV
ncbi:MAG: sodium:solute symporter [Bacteroidales bacterium]|jgi:SSS family transporter|nr:sodium:solute symporter [Bacteroidales bacterium]